MACLLLGPRRSGKTSVLLSCAYSIAAATGDDSSTSILPEALGASGECSSEGMQRPSGTSQPPSVLFICSRAKMESSPPNPPPTSLSPLLSRIQFHYVESYKDILQLCAALHLAASAATWEAPRADPNLSREDGRPGVMRSAAGAEPAHGQAASGERQGDQPTRASSIGRDPLPCAILVDDFLALFDTPERGTQRRAHRAEAGELEGQVSRTVALLVDTARFLTEMRSTAQGRQSHAAEPEALAEAPQRDNDCAPPSLNNWPGGTCSLGRRCVLILAAEGSDVASNALTSHVDAGSEAYQRCRAVLQRWVPNSLRISPMSTPGSFQACGQVGDSSRWQWPPTPDQPQEQDQDRSSHDLRGAVGCPHWSLPEDRSLLPVTLSTCDPFGHGVGEFIHATSCRHETNKSISFCYRIPS